MKMISHVVDAHLQTRRHTRTQPDTRTRNRKRHLCHTLAQATHAHAHTHTHTHMLDSLPPLTYSFPPLGPLESCGGDAIMVGSLNLLDLGRHHGWTDYLFI